MSQTVAPARVLVCGAVYGSSYLRALSGAYGGSARVAVAGILGRGGPSSRGHAQQLRVPYYTGPEEIPSGACDAVCVAVGRPAGVELAEAFLTRGLPVISEHPLRAAEVAALQRTAAAHRVPWHLNAHFGDLPHVAPLITGCQRLIASDRPLFISSTTNPRTLYSLVDILARALGPFGDQSWNALPLVDEEQDFLITVSGPLARSTALLSCQRTVSAHDDGSATLVGHHIEIAFPQGVLELADTYGPVLWRPNPVNGPTGGPLWNAWPEGTAPNLSLIQAQRDAANRTAVELLLQHAHGAPPPAHQQPAHQLEVAATWDRIVEAIGPPILLPAKPEGHS
ncbi:MAG: Gfo/Idh/MocA family oxidoreductase [Acidobacteriota bacterium]